MLNYSAVVLHTYEQVLLPEATWRASVRFGPPEFCPIDLSAATWAVGWTRREGLETEVGLGKHPRLAFLSSFLA